MKDIGVGAAELNAVVAEHKKQVEKWGWQDVDPHTWLGYLTEEVGELAQAINKVYSTYDKQDVEKMDIYKEAVQTATLALKIAAMHRR